MVANEEEDGDIAGLHPVDALCKLLLLDLSGLTATLGITPAD